MNPTKQLVAFSRNHTLKPTDDLLCYCNLLFYHNLYLLSFVSYLKDRISSTCSTFWGWARPSIMSIRKNWLDKSYVWQKTISRERKSVWSAEFHKKKPPLVNQRSPRNRQQLNINKSPQKNSRSPHNELECHR